MIEKKLDAVSLYFSYHDEPEPRVISVSAFANEPMNVDFKVERGTLQWEFHHSEEGGRFEEPRKLSGKEYEYGWY